MKSPERTDHPTGHFPSLEQESQMRADFLYLKTNPFVPDFEKQLNRRHFKRYRQNVISNLIALSYGVHFYNELSNHALYSENTKPLIHLIKNPLNPMLIYIHGHSPYIYINLGCPGFSDEFEANPLSNFEMNTEPEIELPLYICHILDGLEEASHLHLDLLHSTHAPNINSSYDHKDPGQLWLDGGADPNSYRSKLWHEFAALVVQNQYFKNYLSLEYPDEAVTFSEVYQQVKVCRRNWIFSEHL